MPKPGSPSLGVYEDIATGKQDLSFAVWPMGKEAQFARFSRFSNSQDKANQGALAFKYTDFKTQSGIFETCARPAGCTNTTFAPKALLLDSALAAGVEVLWSKRRSVGRYSLSVQDRCI